MNKTMGINYIDENSVESSIRYFLRKETVYCLVFVDLINILNTRTIKYSQTQVDLKCWLRVYFI